MDRWIISLLAAVCAVGLGLKTASATPITLAEDSGSAVSGHPSGVINLTNPPFSGPVNISFDFTDSKAANVSAFICAGNLSNCDAINGVAGGSLIHTLAFSFTSDALSLGNYFYKIAFSSATLGDYTWKLTAEVAATPIPPALLLFLTGLAGMGSIAWRRRGMVGTDAT